MLPTQPRDVAAAIHWVRAHASELHGDPSRIEANPLSHDEVNTRIEPNAPS